MTERVLGPKSYYPSIEKRYGQPIEYWMGILERLGPLKHMEMVAHLKTHHAMGHGHANALVGQYRIDHSL